MHFNCHQLAGTLKWSNYSFDVKGVIVSPPQLKSPSLCIAQELEEFRALLALNGQVSTIRVPHAELLAFQRTVNGTVAIGALKNPHPDYPNGLLRNKAKIMDYTSETLKFEVGFFSTQPAFQGKGHARSIMST